MICIESLTRKGILRNHRYQRWPQYLGQGTETEIICLDQTRAVGTTGIA